MNSTPKVSIIITVYKAEQYIERCARSLFEQTFKELEFVFVNDFTPDTSIQILKKVIDEYSDRKNQVTILNHDYNKGVAAARNTGLDRVRGEYILQVDSDDWVEKSMVEESYVIAEANDSDIVWTDFYVDFPYEPKKSIYRKQNVPGKVDLCINEILSGFLHAGLWNKFMKRSICLLHNIRFPEGVNMCEDTVFVILFLLNSEHITYLQKAFYHYVQNPDALTITRTRQSFESEIKAANILEKTFNTEIFDKYLFIYKSRVKRNIYFSGVFTNDEFLNCFPESTPYIYRGLNRIDKTAIWFALQKKFQLARVVLFFGPAYSKMGQFVKSLIRY